jgi:hypothetical protein
MYSTNLAEISLDEFNDILLAAQLLPSQRKILNQLPENIQKFKSKGLKTMLDLQIFLKKKQNYPAIAEDTGIDQETLVIFNRMVNSYVVKVLPLRDIGIFTDEELKSLDGEKITNTQQYYEALTMAESRVSISARIKISFEKMEYALRIIDLVRINGVGVEFAKILYEIGIKCVADYNKMPSDAILESYRALNQKRALSKATLGISDIDYVRRFCEKLDCEIK